MNLFSKLGSLAKQAASSVKNSLTSAFHSVTGQLANASSGLDHTQPSNSVVQPTPYSTTPSTQFIEVKDSPLGQVAMNSDGSFSTYNPQTGPGTTYYNTNPQTVAAEQKAVNDQFWASTADIRPSTSSTYVQPTDSYGRTSSTTEGDPYINAAGQYVIPSRGFTGIAGQGGAGQDIVNPQGNTGAIGSGSSAHTGLLGSVGTGGGTTSQSDEQKRKKGETQLGTINLTKDTTNAANSILAPYNQSQLQIPNVPDVIDAGFISKTAEAINKLSGASLSFNDRQETINLISQNLIAAKQKLDQQVAVPENPVVDTQEQLDFIQQGADPFGVKQAIDDFRATNTNLSQLQTTRVELMKNIQALNDAYKPIFKDIKDNPDLPKALARRRIEDLATTQKEVLQGFLDQMEITNQQIDDQNQVVNRQFQIVQLSQSAEEKAQTRISNQVKMMLDSGAIAGLTEYELSSLAQAANMPIAALKKAKEASLTPKVDIVTNEDANGNLVGVDKTTGKVVWKVPGMATTTTSGESSAVLGQLQASIKSSPDLKDMKGNVVIKGQTNQYADTALYSKLRSQAKMSASEFDGRFGYMVNPNDKGKLGIGASASSSVTPQSQLSPEQMNLLNQAKATIDAAKQKYQYSPQLREQIIQKAKTLQGGFDLSSYI